MFDVRHLSKKSLNLQVSPVFFLSTLASELRERAELGVEEANTLTE